MKKIVLIVIIAFSSHISFGQVDKSVENEFQAEFYASTSQIKKLADSYGIGIGLDYKTKLFIFGTEIFAITKGIGGGYESDHYLNIDLLGGIHKKYGKFDISLSSGIGLSIRDEGEDSWIETEEKYAKLGIPLRIKVNYIVNDKFLIGIGGYSSFTSSVDIYSLLFSIGYRF